MNTTLLRAIAEDADADEPRLVYADWCEEHGDAGRAALIRIQLELARLPSWDPRRVGLEVQESALLRAHGRAWLGQLPAVDGIEWSGWHRGFVAEAKASSFAALNGALPELSALPVHRLVVPWPDDAAEASASRALRSARHLRIERAIRDDDEPQWLGQAAVLSTIHQLDLVDHFAPESGSRAILLSPHLRQLRGLRMERHQTGSEGVDAIVEADFPELTSLALSEYGDDGTSWSDWDNGLEPDAMETLALWEGLTRLRTLDLSGNRLEGRTLGVLFGSAYLTNLESLVLHYIYENVDGIPWELLEHLRLRSLDVGGNSRFDEDVQLEDLTEATCLLELRELRLEDTVFEEETLAPLLASPMAQQLRALDLTGIDVEDEELAALAQAQLPALSSLKLRGLYKVRDARLASILASELLAPLHSLDVRGNRHSSTVTEALIKSDHTDRLQRLGIQLDEPAEARLRQSALGKRLSETGGLELE